MGDEHRNSDAALIAATDAAFDEMFADLEQRGPSRLPPLTARELDFEGMKARSKDPADRRVIEGIQRIWEESHPKAATADVSKGLIAESADLPVRGSAGNKRKSA